MYIGKSVEWRMECWGTTALTGSPCEYFPFRTIEVFYSSEKTR